MSEIQTRSVQTLNRLDFGIVWILDVRISAFHCTQKGKPLSNLFTVIAQIFQQPHVNQRMAFTSLSTNIVRLSSRTKSS